MSKQLVNSLPQGTLFRVPTAEVLPIFKSVGYGPAVYPEVLDPSNYEDQITFRVNSRNSMYTGLTFLSGWRRKKNPVSSCSVRNNQNLALDVTPLPPQEATPLYFEFLQMGRELTGWDPEMFVVHGDGSLFPAYQFLQDKKTATKLSRTDEGNSPAYWDGFQAEFCTEAVSCHQYGFNRLWRGLHGIYQAARKADPTANLTLQNVFEIPSPILNSAPPECVALGCKPSLNAYNTPEFHVADPLMLPLRVAGGHIHFQLLSGGDQSLAFKTRVAKMMDFFLTIPTVGMFAEIDDPVRRQYYGRAGEFRAPSYGIEYRTLSNAWLGTPQVGHIVMEVARVAAGLAYTGFELPFIGLTDEDIRDTINSCDVQAARAIFEKHKTLWDTAFRWGHFSQFTRMVMEGVESVYPNHRRVACNWRLGDSGFTGRDHEWCHFSPSLYR